MFDSYQVGPREVYVSKTVTVEEKRAPTDASVRLLREMETAARSEVDKAIRVDDTPIKMVVQSMRDHMSGDDIYRAHYSIGGRDLKTEYRHDSYQRPRIEDAIRGLTEAIAKDVAVELMKHTFRSDSVFRKVFGC